MAGVSSATRLQEGKADRVLRVPDVGHSDVVPIHQLPAFPAVEQQEQYCDERNPNAPGKYSGGGARAVADVPIDQRQDDGDQIADHVLPRVADIADARICEEVGEAGKRRAMITPAPSSHIDTVAQFALPV